MTAYTSLRIAVPAVLATLALGSVPLLGEQRGDQTGPPPATVSFLAVTADGTPIPDLTAGDVTLTVAGRARTIEALRFVRFGADPAGPAAETGPAADLDLGGGTIPPPAPYATNAGVAAPSTPGDVRSVMIAVHDMSIRPGTESGLRDAIRAFLDELGPATRVGLVTTPQGQHNVSFTTDRAALDTALDQFAGRAPASLTFEDFRCRTLETLGELRAMLESLSGATTPTSFVFISSGLAEAPIDASSVSQCQLRPDDYTVLTRAASAARAHFFVLQVDGLPPSARGDLGLEALAGATNAQKSLIGNAGDVILARVANETSAYYEASIQIDPGERGNELPMQVDVGRSGATTYAPASVVFSASRGGGERGEAGGGRDMSPQEMLRDVSAFTDLTLKSSAASSRIDPMSENLRVLALFEPIDRSVMLGAAAAGLITEDGRLVAQWSAQPEELTTFPIMAAFEAAPGTYRLRVAATDADGTGGAVDSDLVVGLHPADTIFISDLALVGPRGEGMAPTLEFRDEANAVVFFELYGQPPPDLFATIDLAKSVDGNVLTGVQLQAQPSPEADRFLITGTLPIRALDPGDYVVRVTVGRSPEAKLYQTIRKLPPGGGN